MNSGSFKNVNKNVFTNHIYLIYTYEQDLALNNLQRLMCHNPQPNHKILICIYMYV